MRFSAVSAPPPPLGARGATALGLFALSWGALWPAATFAQPPPEAGRDVRDYGAVGDGVTDDTAAIQAALDDGRGEDRDYFGRPKTLLFPPGTYRITDTLTWRGCCVQLQGAGRDATVLRLDDGAAGFGDPASPRPVVRAPRVEGNRSHRQYVFDLGIDVGRGNPGAVALDFIAHNNGAVARVRLRAPDRAAVGLALTEAWPGPLLVRDVEIEGFDLGVRVAHPEYAPTFEDLTLRGQRVAGMRIEDNVVPIHRLRSEQPAGIPAVVSEGSGALLVLLDARLSGDGGPALALEGQAYLRDIEARGYARAVAHPDAPSGRAIDELVIGEIRSVFDGPSRSLGLPIEPSPTFEADADAWAYAETRWPRDGRDAERLREALASGAPNVYFRGGATSVWGDVVEVPAHVRRIVGFGHSVNGFGDEPVGLRLVVREPSDAPLIVEQFGYGVTLEHACSRPVALRHGGYRYEAAPGAGPLFLDDVVTSDLHLVPGQRVWARQLNTEGDVNVVNDGAALWVLGQKTERFGTVIETRGGGRTELLGGLVYPSRRYEGAGEGLRAFLSEGSAQSLVFGTSVYVERGFHPEIVVEVRDGERRAWAAPAPRSVPLFVGWREDDPGVPPPGAPPSGGGGDAGDGDWGGGDGGGGDGAGGDTPGDGAPPSTATDCSCRAAGASCSVGPGRSRSAGWPFAVFVIALAARRLRPRGPTERGP